MKLFPRFKCPLSVLSFCLYEEEKDDCSHIPALLHNPSFMAATYKILPTFQTNTCISLLQQ